MTKSFSTTGVIYTSGVATTITDITALGNGSLNVNSAAGAVILYVPQGSTTFKVGVPVPANTAVWSTFPSGTIIVT